jgi:urease accessory protein
MKALAMEEADVSLLPTLDETADEGAAAATAIVAVSPVVTPRWQARLNLGFANDAGTSRMVERTHTGPLRVQKPLYPEGPQVCHAIVVHPPGGVVGGDELHIAVSVGAQASALMTTPGAAKWYKANANGYLSQQSVNLQVAAGASLEWLPQETIFFNRAQVRLEQTVELAPDAAYLGCEILCFGRTASGERFDAGCITQSTTIKRGGKLIWFEHGSLGGSAASMNSVLTLAGATVCATLLAAGQPLQATAIEAIRGVCGMAAGEHGQVGVTQMKQILVVRYLGQSSEAARQVMIAAWQIIRPHMLRREAVVPRIWST